MGRLQLTKIFQLLTFPPNNQKVSTLRFIPFPTDKSSKRCETKSIPRKQQALQHQRPGNRPLSVCTALAWFLPRSWSLSIVAVVVFCCRLSSLQCCKTNGNPVHRCIDLFQNRGNEGKPSRQHSYYGHGRWPQQALKLPRNWNSQS